MRFQAKVRQQMFAERGLLKRDEERTSILGENYTEDFMHQRPTKQYLQVESFSWPSFIFGSAGESGSPTLDLKLNCSELLVYPKEHK